MENKSEQRPWGKYEIIYQGPGVQVKCVEVNPGKRLSLQKHKHRSEQWIFVQGAGSVTLDGREMEVARGSVAQVPVEQSHRVHNKGNQPLRFIEVQLGDYLGEDDIVRLEDDFGRA
ncbi:MAG: phosphomannose isomerase type II C-terminal cupin domain [Candidatus Omnitrophica bacterium]|nr:phosphomannose isomerase type II C-terminal cupin domain [Candidatus Omnitrophota bacterium]